MIFRVSRNMKLSPGRGSGSRVSVMTVNCCFDVGIRWNKERSPKKYSSMIHTNIFMDFPRTNAFKLSTRYTLCFSFSGYPSIIAVMWSPVCPLQFFNWDLVCNLLEYSVFNTLKCSVEAPYWPESITSVSNERGVIYAKVPKINCHEKFKPGKKSKQCKHTNRTRWSVTLPLGSIWFSSAN